MAMLRDRYARVITTEEAIREINESVDGLPKARRERRERDELRARERAAAVAAE